MDFLYKISNLNLEFGNFNSKFAILIYRSYISYKILNRMFICLNTDISQGKNKNLSTWRQAEIFLAFGREVDDYIIK